MHKPLVYAAAMALVSAGVTTPAAAADDLPQYDVSKYCLSNFGNYDGKSQEFLFENCTKTETEKQQKLRRVWQKIPADIHKTCSAQMSAFKEGSYMLLSSCAVGLYAMRWFESGGVVE